MAHHLKRLCQGENGLYWDAAQLLWLLPYPLSRMTGLPSPKILSPLQTQRAKRKLLCLANSLLFD